MEKKNDNLAPPAAEPAEKPATEPTPAPVEPPKAASTLPGGVDASSSKATRPAPEPVPSIPEGSTPPARPPTPIDDASAETTVNEQPKNEPIPAQKEESAPEPTAPTETPPAPEPKPKTHATQPPQSFIHRLLIKARAKIQFRKRKKLDKVLALALERGRIQNDDVQKLLRVSDATATRYLVALVKEGKLKRVGHPRRARYEPIS